VSCFFLTHGVDIYLWFRCPLAYLKTAVQTSRKFSVCVPGDRGSVLRWRQCNRSHTFAVVDDVTFSHSAWGRRRQIILWVVHSAIRTYGYYELRLRVNGGEVYCKSVVLFLCYVIIMCTKHITTDTWCDNAMTVTCSCGVITFSFPIYHIGRPFCIVQQAQLSPRDSAQCVVSVEILPTATQQCRNYLYDKYQLSLIDPCDKIVP